MSIIEQLKEHNANKNYPFHMPGHKRRVFAAKELESLYKLDVTEIEGFDNLHDARGIILAAQQKAAKVFGADKAHFLVNGSTSGILAGICGCVHEQDDVYVARNCHKSVYNGVMLSGATPHYIYPEKEAYFEINGGITKEQVRDALTVNPPQNRGLVIITSPTYEGVVSDIEGIAQVCHEHNVTLMVDAAHGAHFGFSDAFPASAISKGADIVVTSVHKTLLAPTQTALILINNSCREYERIAKMLTVFQSSSPSYVLMAGIESCVDYVSQNADKLFKEYEAILDDFYKKAQELNNISVLSKDKLTCEGSYDFDRSKIVITDRSQRLSGLALQDTLIKNYGLWPEMAAGGYCLMMTSIADDKKAMNRLYDALKDIDEALESGSEVYSKRGILKKLHDRIIGRTVVNNIFSNIVAKEEYLNGLFNNDINMAQTKLLSKEAIWADNSQWIPVELSEGKISASYVCFYPPGTPVVIPGEELSGEIVDEILAGIKMGLTVNGINEDKEIEVIWE